MKKIIWIPIIILIVGVCLALAGFAYGGMKGFWVDRGGFHLSENSPGKLITVDESYNSFKNIEIKADFIERIEFKEGSAYAVRGQNYERYGGLDVELSGDTLIVDARADRIWNVDFGINNLFHKNDSWLEITYPAGAKFGLVDTNLSAGNLNLNSIKCETLDINNSFGDIRGSSVLADKISINADSGDIDLTGITATGNASVKNSFGSVGLENVKAAKLNVTLDSGDLNLTGIEADTLIIKNSFGGIVLDGAETGDLNVTQNSGDFRANDVNSGDINVTSSFGEVNMDRTAFSGLCEVNNSSGDLTLKLLMNRDDISYELNTSAGSVTVDGAKSSGSVSSRVPGSAISLKATVSFGDIKVEFLK